MWLFFDVIASLARQQSTFNLQTYSTRSVDKQVSKHFELEVFLREVMMVSMVHVDINYAFTQTQKTPFSSLDYLKKHMNKEVR